MTKIHGLITRFESTNSHKDFTLAELLAGLIAREVSVKSRLKGMNKTLIVFQNVGEGEEA